MEALPASSPLAFVEAPLLTDEEGGELILKISNKKEPQEDDIMVARELSNRLGGLPLAVDIIARLYKAREHSLSSRHFLSYYNDQLRALDKQAEFAMLSANYPEDSFIHWTKNNNTLWETVFAEITSEAALWMSMICYMAPQNIPQWMLQPEHEMHFPLAPGWDFPLTFDG